MGESNHTFNPFVIFGAAKSGTTWLQRIVDAHPACHCHFQIPILPLTPAGRQAFRPSNIHVVYGERRSPYAGVFASEEKEQIYHWKSRFLKRIPILQAGFLEPYLEDGTQQGQRDFLLPFYRGMQGAIAEYILKEGVEPGIERFGTKAVTDLDQLFEVFPKAKVLTIVRDGRDVVVSKRFHAYRMNAFMHGDEKSRIHYWINHYKPTRFLLLAANKAFNFLRPSHFKDVRQTEHLLNQEVLTKYTTEWHRKVSYIQGFARKYPEQFLTVHYEDLLDDPITHLRHIFSFLEVDHTEAILQAVHEQTTFAKQAKKGNNSFFRKGTAGDWVQYFKPEDKVLFKKIAGETLVELGYEKDQTW